MRPPHTHPATPLAPSPAADLPLRLEVFSPTPEVAAAVIDDLADPDLTLRDVAERYGATLEALTLFLTRPDIAQRLENIQSAVALRTRLIATNYLPTVALTLTRILDAHEHEESHIPIRPGNAQAAELRRRSRETARRAAALILRLARFHPGAPPPPRNRPSSPPPDAPPASPSPRIKRARAFPADPALTSATTPTPTSDTQHPHPALPNPAPTTPPPENYSTPATPDPTPSPVPPDPSDPFPAPQPLTSTPPSPHLPIPLPILHHPPHAPPRPP